MSRILVRCRVVCFCVLSLLPVASAAQGVVDDGAVEQDILQVFVELDDRLSLGAFPDGGGDWPSRVAAALERRQRIRPAGPFAADLERQLAAALRGFDASSTETRVRGGLLELVARLDAKLDGTQGVGGSGLATTVGASPANDLCAAALPFDDEAVSGTTVGAGADGGGIPSCGFSSAGPSVWYRYTAADTGPLTFDTAGSSFDTVLSLHTACPGEPGAEELGCSDDPDYSPQARLDHVPTTIGEEVWLRVGGYAGLAGDFQLAVTEAPAFAGVVTRGDTGAPVEGARVRVYGYPSFGYGVWLAGETTTTADGSYLAVRPQSRDIYGPFFIYVTHDELIGQVYDGVDCPFGFTLSDCKGATEISAPTGVVDGFDLTLESAGSVSGRLTDANTGDGIEAFVTLYAEVGGSLTSIQSDPDGTYHLRGLPPGNYRISAFGELYQREVWNDLACPTPCDVTAGDPVVVSAGEETSGIDLALIREGSIAGTMTALVTGDPIEFPRVELYDAGGLRHSVGLRTKSDGTYETLALPPGDYYVVTTVTGYQDEIYDDLPAHEHEPTAGTPVSVVTGSATTGIDFALQKRGGLAGRVTETATGLPLDGARVYAYDSAGRRVGSTTTEDDGSYEIGGLLAGDYTVRASLSTHQDELWDDVACPSPCDVTGGTAVSVSLDAITPGVDFVLDRFDVIEIRTVASDTGLFLAGNVRLYDETGGQVYNRSVYHLGQRLEEIEPGTYFVEFWLGWPSDYQDELFAGIPCEPSCDLSTGTPVTVGLGGGVIPVDFSLEPCPHDTVSRLTWTLYPEVVEIEACEIITAGDSAVLMSGADVTFRTGRTVALSDGFVVENGASFRVEIVPEWSAGPP